MARRIEGRAEELSAARQLGKAARPSREAASTSATQAVRKSMVQGAFKELVDVDHGKLALPEPAGGELPSAANLASLKALAEDSESSLVRCVCS
jgi:hypothetical protein